MSVDGGAVSVLLQQWHASRNCCFNMGRYSLWTIDCFIYFFIYSSTSELNCYLTRRHSKHCITRFNWFALLKKTNKHTSHLFLWSWQLFFIYVLDILDMSLLSVQRVNTRFHTQIQTKFVFCLVLQSEKERLGDLSIRLPREPITVSSASLSSHTCET